MPAGRRHEVHKQCDAGDDMSPVSRRRRSTAAAADDIGNECWKGKGGYKKLACRESNLVGQEGGIRRGNRRMESER